MHALQVVSTASTTTTLSPPCATCATKVSKLTLRLDRVLSQIVRQECIETSKLGRAKLSHKAPTSTTTLAAVN